MTNILIEVRGGNIQNIIASKDVKIIIIDYDNIEAGDSPVVETASDQILPKGTFYQTYCDESDPQAMEIRDELKRNHI